MNVMVVVLTIVVFPVRIRFEAALTYTTNAREKKETIAEQTITSPTKHTTDMAYIASLPYAMWDNFNL